MKIIEFDSSRRDNERPDYVKDNITRERFKFISYNGGHSINLERKDGSKYSPSAKDKSRFTFYVGTNQKFLESSSHNSSSSSISVSTSPYSSPSYFSYLQPIQQEQLSETKYENSNEKQYKQIQELNDTITKLKNERINDQDSLRKLLDEKDNQNAQIKKLDNQISLLNFEKSNNQFQQHNQQLQQLIKELEQRNSQLKMENSSNIESLIKQKHQTKELDFQITLLKLDSTNNERKIKELESQTLVYKSNELKNYMEYQKQKESLKEQIKSNESTINTLRLNETKRNKEHYDLTMNFHKEQNDLYTRFFQLQKDNLSMSTKFNAEENKNNLLEKEVEEANLNLQNKTIELNKQIDLVDKYKSCEKEYLEKYNEQNDLISLLKTQLREKENICELYKSFINSMAPREKETTREEKEESEKEERKREELDRLERDRQQRDQEKREQEKREQEIKEQEEIKLREQKRKEKEKREQEIKEQEEIKQRDKEIRERKQKEKQELEDKERLKKLNEQLEFLKKVESAKRPDDIFSRFADLKIQRTQYLKLIHPDKCKVQNYSGELYHKFNDAFDILNGILNPEKSNYFKK